MRLATFLGILFCASAASMDLQAHPRAGQAYSPPQTHAQPDELQLSRPSEDLERAQQIQPLVQTAIDGQDYARAEELLREQITLQPNNFAPYYNLACVLALRDDKAGAIEQLGHAIERGFVDIHQLKRDPHLDAIRGEKQYQRIVNGWSAILDAHLAANLGQARRVLEGREARYETLQDDRLRVAWISAMDVTSFEAARTDIERLYDWGLDTIFVDLQDPEEALLDPYVLIILPAPRDFLRWIVATFGPAAASGNAGIGGLYDHDLRRLVAQDLGPTLRHEFFHILHWRSMMRHGQTHPIWIQEGLCSLVEENEIDGELIRPVPSWRTNIVRRLNSAGRLQPLSRLASMPREHFTGYTALANYAQARAFFLYLHDRGKLGDWYSAYIRGFDDDPTGLKAVEEVFARPLTEIEREYRAWISRLPQVAEQERPGEATLGLDVDPGSGDGPVIVSIPRERRAIMREAGLRTGDVITAVNSRPTRDLNELVRIVGEHRAGEEVEVSYRRGRTHGTARVILVPR